METKYVRILGTKKRGQRVRKDRIRLLSVNGEPCDRILGGIVAVRTYRDENGEKKTVEVTISGGHARKGVNVPFLLKVEEKLEAALIRWAKERERKILDKLSAIKYNTKQEG